MNNHFIFKRYYRFNTNDTFENQDDLIYSEMLEIGEFQQSGKIVKLKDDKSYVLGYDGNTFQDKLLKMFLITKTSMKNIMRMFYHWKMNSKKRCKK